MGLTDWMVHTGELKPNYTFGVSINNIPLKEITDPGRVRAFARFFKNYMGISSLVVAALPIPFSALRLFPVYKAQSYFLSVFTSLFCFLILGFIFFVRHSLAKLWFSDYLEGTRHQTDKKQSDLPKDEAAPSGAAASVDLVPLLLIIISLSSALLYYQILSQNKSGVPLDKVLDEAPLNEIPGGISLMMALTCLCS